MLIPENGQCPKTFLSPYQISSFSLFVKSTSRIFVGFVMEKIGHLLRYLPSC